MIRKFLAAAAALFLSAGAAQAEVVTFEFEGVVTYATYLMPVGTSVSGRFSWDTSAPQSGGTPDYQYSIYTAPYTLSFTATAGSHVMASNNVYVAVFNDMGGNVEDMIDITGQNVVVDGTAYPAGYLAMRLASGPGKTQVFKDVSLPERLELARFDAENQNGLQLFDGSPYGQLLDVKLTSVRRVPGDKAP